MTGGTVLLEGSDRPRPATLGVTDGAITHVSTAPVDAAETLALDGEVVLPGLVDGHVHFRKPGYAENSVASHDWST